MKKHNVEKIRFKCRKALNERYDGGIVRTSKVAELLAAAYISHYLILWTNLDKSLGEGWLEDWTMFVVVL